MKKALRLISLGVALLVSVLSLVSFSSAATEKNLGSIVKEKCMVCHVADSAGKVSRIDYMRKTPEGFEATVNRMIRLWGLKLTAEEKRQVVKDLSQAKPLAPKETEEILYLLTGDRGIIEQVPNEAVKNACTRCHSFARVAAQRRSQEEWIKLEDMHVALNPALIMQTRDVDWPKVAKEAITWLAEKYPLDNQEYQEWRTNVVPQAIDGKWQVNGYQPGKGKYFGTIEFTGIGNGEYQQTRNIAFSDGTESKWTGTGRLYSGYSLRSSLAFGEEKLVGVLIHQGDTFKGKWHSLKDFGISGEETYYRDNGVARIISVDPQGLQRGTTSSVTIRGINLPVGIKTGDISLGKGVTVKKVISSAPNAVMVEVVVSSGIDLKEDVKVGSVLSKGLVTLFGKVDYMKITPEYGVARLGGASVRPKEGVQFQVFGYSNGPDDKAGTADDISLGLLEGVQWSLKEFVNGPGDDELKWVGAIDQRGYFMPANDGSNPQRTFSTDNAGAVLAVGTYQPPGGGNPVVGEAKLLVTVPVYRSVE